MRATASRRQGWLLAALALAAALLIAQVGLAHAATGATVEVTIVNAFATTSRSASGTGNPSGPDLNIFIDGQQVASALPLGGTFVLPAPLAPGPHLVQISLPGESMFLQEQDINIPDTASADVAIGYSPAGGAGLATANVFANDLSAVPADSTALVLRNISDDPAATLYLFAPSTPDALEGVPRGGQGAATVPVGFTEMRLIPTNCADDCSVLFQQDFPAATRTIVYAVGRTGDTYDTSSFDAVNRILGQEGGTLGVTKAFDPKQSGYTGAFTVNVVCEESAFSRTLALAAGQTAIIAGVPAGTGCTISEPELPAAPDGWAWGEPLIDPVGGAVAVARGSLATVTVTNRISPVPAIALAKQADAAGFYQAGEVIRYTLTASNTGQAALTSVRVSDPLPGLSSLSCGSGDLAPGQSMTCEASYRVTGADVWAGLVRNTATVTAMDPDGTEVSASAAVEVPRALVATGAPLGSAAGTAWALIVAGSGLLVMGRRHG